MRAPMASSSVRACSSATPGFKRPVTTIQWKLRVRSAGVNASGRHMRLKVRSKMPPSGMTPMTVYGTPSSRIDRPTSV